MIKRVKFIIYDMLGHKIELKDITTPELIDFYRTVTKGDVIIIDKVNYKIETKIISFDTDSVVYILERLRQP